jgi:hypothetical protein
MSRVWLLLLILSEPVAAAELAGTAGYVVTQSASPVSGRQVEILLDERFNDSVRDLWAGADQGYLCRGERSSEIAALCASLAERPAVPPWIRLLGEKGKVLDQRKFERELASVESVGTVADGLVLLGVSVDFGVGFGSYAGFSTYFVVVRDDRFEWGRVANPPSEQPEELVLGRAGGPYRAPTAGGRICWPFAAARAPAPVRPSSKSCSSGIGSTAPIGNGPNGGSRDFGSRKTNFRP